MTDKPILFLSPMVRAIQDGRKTQTRRVADKKLWNLFDAIEKHNGKPGWQCLDFDVKCPWDVDRLWVRETWCVHLRYNDVKPLDLPDIKYLQQGVTYMADVYKGEKSLWMGKSRQSIFLPRRFSRINLIVTAKRAERLQEIGIEDIHKEGIDRWRDYEGGQHLSEVTCRNSFHRLWDSINGKKYPWESDPYVWVIEFRRAV